MEAKEERWFELSAKWKVNLSFCKSTKNNLELQQF
jgi:hypothetical protein